MKSGVWLLELEKVEKLILSQSLKFLSSNEKQRYKKIRHIQRRKAFVVGRILVRLAYQWCYGGRLCNVQVRQNVNGRPYVTNGMPFDFNLSNSGGLCVCAFTTQGRVGVDIERHRSGRDINGIARNYFHLDEQEMLAKTNDVQSLFYQLWVLKEAMLKMTGVGFRVPLRDVCFTQREGQWLFQGELAEQSLQIKVKKVRGYYLGLVVNEGEFNQIPYCIVGMKSDEQGEILILLSELVF